MKKILGLTVAAVLVMALVGGGTWAYFSDPETSPNNILTAGTLDLTINGGNAPVTLLTVTAANPGTSGSNSTTLQNVGSIDGRLDIAISGIGNTESAAGTEYTGDSINGTSGELGGVATMAMYIDVTAGGGFNGSDIGLKYDGTKYSQPTLNYATVNSYTGATWTNAYSANMTAGLSKSFYILWDVPFGVSADNTFQGDSVSVNMTFTLEQPTP